MPKGLATSEKFITSLRESLSVNYESSLRVVLVVVARFTSVAQQRQPANEKGQAFCTEKPG
jgi:hypothetical protein